MSKSKSFTIGIDLGGTKILTVLFDSRFRVVAEIKAKTKPEKGERHLLDTFTDGVDAVLHDGGVSRSEISGIGIGSPGIIDTSRGVVVVCPNIGFLNRYPLGPKLSRLTRLPVVLGNDVKTGLYGEHQFGAARGYANVVGIFLGTGIGGALILNNQLYMGADGGAGEVGHMQIDDAGPFCGCGQRGCFEALAGRLAIAAEAAALAAKQKAPHLAAEAGTDVLQIKSSTLQKSIARGDKAIELLVRSKARLVGSVMANLVNLLNPNLIVLGGGVVEAMGSLIVREAEAAMRERAMPALSKHVKVVAAKLKDHSVAMGAAKMAIDQFSVHNRRHHG